MTDFAMYLRFGEGHVRLHEMDDDVRRRCRIARDAMRRMFDECYAEAEALDDNPPTDFDRQMIFDTLAFIRDAEELRCRVILETLDLTGRQYEEYLYCCVQMEDVFQGSDCDALFALHRFTATCWWR